MEYKERQVEIYLSLRQFSEKYKFITLSGIRQLVARNKDFRKSCVKKLGKKILLKESNVLEYMNNLPSE